MCTGARQRRRNGLRYHSPTGIPSHTAHRIKSRSKQGKQSVQTGPIAQVTCHHTSRDDLKAKSTKRESSGAGNPEVAVLGQGRLTQSQPARSQPYCLVPFASHPNHCVLLNILLRPGSAPGPIGFGPPVQRTTDRAAPRAEYYYTLVEMRRTGDQAMWLGAGRL